MSTIPLVTVFVDVSNPDARTHLAGSLALQSGRRIGYTDHTMDWRLRDGQRRLRVDGKIRVADQAGQGKARQ